MLGGRREKPRNSSRRSWGVFAFAEAEAGELLDQLIGSNETTDVHFAQHTPDVVFVVRKIHDEGPRDRFRRHLVGKDTQWFVRHLLHPGHTSSKNLEHYHGLAADRQLHNLEDAVPVALDILLGVLTEEFFAVKLFALGEHLVGIAIRWRDPKQEHGRPVEDDHMLRYAEHMDYPVAIDTDALLHKLGISRPARGDHSPGADEHVGHRIVPGYVAYRQAYEDYIRRWPEAFGSGPARVMQTKDRIRLAWSFIEQHLSISHWHTAGLLADVLYPHSKKRLVHLNWQCSQRANLLGYWPDALMQEVCNYFGSRVAFYFAFLQFVYRFAFRSAAVLLVLKLAAYAAQGALREVAPSCDLPFIAVGFMVSLSGAVFLKLWARESSAWACHWGAGHVKTQVEEAHHPSFRGTIAKDPIDWSKLVLQADPTRRRIGRMLSAIFTVAYIVFVVLSIVANFRVRRLMQVDEWWKKHAPALTTGHMDVLLSLQVRIFTMMWQRIAATLTQWEQHKYWHEYEIALDQRVTLLLTITMVAAMGYTAFVEPLWGMCPPLGEGAPPGEPPQMGCMASLQNTLRTMVVTQFLVGLLDPLHAWAHLLVNEYRERGDPTERSFLEHQCRLPPYDGQTESLDFQELLFPLTYFWLFGAVAPECMLLGLLATALSQRSIDLWKLLHLYRRPRPTETAGIGERRIWQLHAIALVGTAVNWAVVVTYAAPFARWSAEERVIVWGVGIGIFVAANLLVEACFQDSNAETHLLHKRMQWQQEMVHRIGVRRMKDWEPKRMSSFSGSPTATVDWHSGLSQLQRDGDLADFWEDSTVGKFSQAVLAKQHRGVDREQLEKAEAEVAEATKRRDVAKQEWDDAWLWGPSDVACELAEAELRLTEAELKLAGLRDTSPAGGGIAASEGNHRA